MLILNLFVYSVKILSVGLLSFKEITSKAQLAFARFPATLIWVLLGSFYCMYKIGIPSYDFFDKEIPVLLTLILGVSWFIGIQFFIEQLNSTRKWQWLKSLILVLLLLFYWHLPDFGKHFVNPEFIIRFFILLIAGHLFVFFAPFVFKWNKEAYWNYLKTVGYAIVRSAFFSGVLYLGLVLALLAIQALFSLNIPDRWFGQLFVFCLGIVNTWVYLSDFPKNILQQTIIQFNKALEVFVKYILIPLIILYLIILYSYSFKILFQWELPKGWVSYLVTALAILGLQVQVFIHPVQKDLNSWTINRFYPWFYILLLPLIVLLFVAIFRRIYDYGVTENRYLVLVIAFWIFGVALYMLLSKSKNLKILPVSLFVLAILSSFGFWGVFEVSKKSQVKQFINVFEKVTKNGKLASREQYEQLTSIITYLDKREAVFNLDEIIGISLTTNNSNSPMPKFRNHDYLDPIIILDSLDITVDPNDLSTLKSTDDYYHYYANDKTQNLNIEGYSHLSPMRLNGYNDYNQEIGRFKISFNLQEKVLMLYSQKNNKKAIELHLKEKLSALTKYGYNLEKVPSSEMQIYAQNDTVALKLIFTNLSFNKNKDSIALNYGEAFLLLKQR